MLHSLENAIPTIRLRNLPTRNKEIYMVGQANVKVDELELAFLRVMCDINAEELYVELPKYYNSRNYYYWIENRDVLDRFETMILDQYRTEIRTGDIDAIPDVNDILIDGRYRDFESFKPVTFNTRDMKKK